VPIEENSGVFIFEKSSPFYLPRYVNDVCFSVKRVTEPKRGGAAPVIPREFKNAAAFLRRTRYAEAAFSSGEIRLNEFLHRVEAAADRFLRAIGL